MMRSILLPVCCLCLYLTSCNKLPCEPPLDRLQTVFTDDTFQLTGVAISPEGRLFTNYPLWSETYKYAVVEVDGKHAAHKTEANLQTKYPYPNLYMNGWQTGQTGKDKWVCVQAVVTDDDNNLWVVDPASPKMEGVYDNSHKLVKINLATNVIEKTYFFEGVADVKSYVNDVRIDGQRQYAYLTNSNEGGIIVVNLTTGK